MPNRIPFHGDHPPQLRGDQHAAKAERDRFYAGRRWRGLRSLFLKRHPLCQECLRNGLTTAAVVVHHVIERLARPDLAYTWSNLEAACNPCHTRHHKGKA